MNVDVLLTWLGVGTVAAPAALLAVVGLSLLVGYTLSERAIARWTQAAVVIGLSILGLLARAR